MTRLIAALLLATGALRVHAAEPWTARAPLSEPRQEVGVAALGGQVYVIGGFRSNATIADAVEVYDPNADAWSFAAPLPTPLHHAAVATVGGKLYVIGGFTDALFLSPVASVFEYDPLGDSWTPKTPMPTARGSSAVAVVDGKIYAAGGSPAARESDFAVYDPIADGWTTLTNMPTPRNHLAAGAIAGKFYAAGGRSGGIAGITAALEEYDPNSMLWSAKAPMPTARGGIAGVVFQDRLYVFGGEGNPAHPAGVFAQNESYDLNSNTWDSHAPMSTPRHGTGAAVLATRIHIPGGGSVEGFGVTGVHEVFNPLSPPPVVVPTLPRWGPTVLACLLLATSLEIIHRRRRTA